MTLDGLTTILDALDRYDYTIIESDTHGDHIRIIDWDVQIDDEKQEAIDVEIAKLDGHDWARIKAAAALGRDVAGHTRVTGYFSTVGNWHAGKRGELRDRHRSTI